MFHSIIVPLDGSRFGEHALPYASTIARRAGAGLQIVHKHVPPAPVHPDSVEGLAGLAGQPKAKPDTRPQERAYLESVAARLTSAGVPTTTKLLEGPIIEVLSEYAAGSGADLVVMTTHGRGPLSRFWLGSVADALMRKLDVPLLLVRPCEEEEDAEPPLHRVLVPLNGSEEAEAILGPVAELGAEEVTLLRVVEPLPVYGLDVPLYAAPSDPSLSRRLLEQATRYLEEQARKLRAAGARVMTLVVLGTSAAAAILSEAKRVGCDLIAMETAGRGGLARLMLGSVADKVVRGAEVPVLVHRTAANTPPK